jgi:pimeloyl-ACP methyl ester carboxylesterase
VSWRDHYPFESHYLEVTDAGRLHFVDEGSGPPLLLSHGNPTWSFYYRKLIRAWSKNYRVIAVDHLGCGLSDKPQDYDYCLGRHTENLLSLVQTLALCNVTIVGHDWGGAIGLNAVRRAPHSFGRIVMFNTGAFPPRRIPWRIAACRTPGLGQLAVRGGNLFARAALRMAMVNPNEMSSEERSGMIAPYNSFANRVAIQRFVDDIPFSRRHRTWTELKALESDLPSMADRPALLIWGMKDWCFDQRCLDRFTSVWPQAEIHRIPNAGHWVVEDAADQIVVDVEQFLKRTRDIRRAPSASNSVNAR